MHNQIIRFTVVPYNIPRPIYGDVSSIAWLMCVVMSTCVHVSSGSKNMHDTHCSWHHESIACACMCVYVCVCVCVCTCVCVCNGRQCIVGYVQWNYRSVGDNTKVRTNHIAWIGMLYYVDKTSKKKKKKKKKKKTAQNYTYYAPVCTWSWPICVRNREMSPTLCLSQAVRRYIDQLAHAWHKHTCTHT